MIPLQLENDAAWKSRFRLPSLLWTDVAKNAPTRGVAATDQSGVYQLYAWDVPSGSLRQLSHRPAGKMFGRLSPDGRFVYYLDDQQGNEIGHLVRVPYDGDEPQDLTPGLPLYSTNAGTINRMGERLALNVVTRDGFSLYLINLKPLGEPRLIRRSKRVVAGPVLSAVGDLVVWHSTERSKKTQYHLMALDSATGEIVRELWDGSETSVVAHCFSPVPRDPRVLTRTNRDGVNRPFIWNPLSDERLDLQLELEGDVDPLDWSDDARWILLCQSHGAQQKLWLYDLPHRALGPLEYPPGAFGRWSIAYLVGEQVFAHREDSSHPLHVTKLDIRTGNVDTALALAHDVPPGHRVESVSFPSIDGTLIQGWLGLPDVREHGPFATIIQIHGGPFAATVDAFSPLCQMWLDHRCAFLAVNYRGSTGFGRTFKDKIIGNPGYWEVEDLVAARNWLVQQGIARPDSVFVTGGSYGGYLTLLALGKYPDLWAGGMAERAIADWKVCYQDEKDTHRGMQVALFGGTPDEKPEQHAMSSPVTYVENIQAPILVIQGRNDTRTPARQMEMFVEKAKRANKAIDIHWYDAGHLEIPVEQQIEHKEMMLRFVWSTLQGAR